MTKRPISRRAVLKGSAAAAAATVFASPARAQLPPPAPLNDALIAAAKKEGKVSFYTAMDLDFAQRLGKAFEAKYGIATKVERSGAERVFQRIGQEHGAKIFAVDVANTADAAHCIIWKRNGWLAPYLPEEVAQALRQGLLRRRWARDRDAHPGVADRLQHRAGEEGRRAEELQGPARPEMGGQDGQGPSGL